MNEDNPILSLKRDLIESEERSEAILKTTIDGFILVDKSGRIVEVNDAYCRMTGYTRDEILSKTVTDMDAFESSADSSSRIEHIIKSGGIRFETQHRKKDGSVIDVEVSTHYRDMGKGCIISFLKDVTDQKKAEKALRESKEKLRSLNENIGNGMVYQIDTGIDGKTREFTYISPAVERFHGITVEQAINDPFLIYNQISDEHKRILVEKEAHAIETMSTFNIDVLVDYPPGEKTWRRFASTPRRTLDGHLLWDGIEFDVTLEKQKEAEGERLKNQLVQAQKIESVGQLAGGVAHDFNNMLSVIIGHAEMAMMQIDEGHPVHADLQEILGAAKRSADLTRQLLAFARKQAVSPRPVDVNLEACRMMNMLKRMIGEDIELIWQPEEGLWPVNIDPVQIDQILVNLSINARDALVKDGIITIRTGNQSIGKDHSMNIELFPGDYVFISVSDNGVGMEKSVMDHLFEPFFTTKDIGKGTGMGLSMVYGIVKQNKGGIHVESQTGKGSTFRIFLPRFSENSVVYETRTDKASLLSKGRETVLIVEDEPSILKMGKSILEKLGYRILASHSPVEALSIAETHDGIIHLLITDVIMPEMNGRELVEKLSVFHPSLKVLYMSGYTANVISMHGVLEKDVHFIQKPFSIQDFSEKVREALG
jgi:PAS domain S-box-containing protein